MKQLPTWEFILECLRQELPVMLLYVLDSQGSSPGRQGFMMAVNSQGRILGSIGGGIMEHKFSTMAREMLQEEMPGDNLLRPLIRKQVHDKTAAKDQSGMICSGEQTLLLCQVKQEDRFAVEAIIDSMQRLENGLLQFSPAGMIFREKAPVPDYAYLYDSDDNWIYKEKTGYKNHLYLIGGGHCSLALSRLAVQLDFCIHLFEEREELATLQQNTYAHDKKIISDYSSVASLIPGGQDRYVVVMSVGYRTDYVALQSLLKARFSFKYLGVLGSAKKMEKLRADLLADGFPPEDLSRMRSPIGLPINSRTPDEIAVSIAAEIIGVKNGV